MLLLWQLNLKPSTLARDAVAAGYLIVAGFTATPSSEQLPNPATLIAALRAGRTIAEAFALAIPTINGSARLIADPLAHVRFPRQGYNVYRRHVLTGADQLVAVAPAGSEDLVIAGFAAGDEKFLSVRAVSRMGTIDQDAVNPLRVAFDEDGELIGPPPPMPIDLRLLPGPGGVMTATFACRFSEQLADVDHFNIYAATGEGAFDLDSPTATVPFRSSASFRISLGTFTHGAIVKAIVSAMSAAGVEVFNRMHAIAVADAEAPADPQSVEFGVTR